MVVILILESMEGSEQLKNLIESVIFLKLRIPHWWSARPKNKARATAIATMTDTLQQARKLKADNIKIVVNVGLYLLLLDQDVADFTNDLINAIGDRRRRFIAKHEAILLYEAAEDIPQLLGQEFRAAVKALGIPNSLMSRLNGVSSDLSEFWKDERNFLGSIRNAIAAHRERDALRYLEVLQALEPLKVMRRAADMSELLERLAGVLIEIALLTSSPATILQDMMRSSRKSNNPQI